MNIDKSTGKEYKGITSLKSTSQETINSVLALYSEGRSQNFIEKELRMTRRTIRGILIKHDRIRGRVEQQTVYAHTFTSLREDAFDIITDESAYWLGFLYADGYITNPDGKRLVGILLKGDDVEHLKKFKEFLKAPQKIFTGVGKLNGKEYPQVGIHIGSRRLWDKLREWGFTHNKSKDAIPPQELRYNKHFWRGMIDGDGCLTARGVYKKPVIHICGTYEMVLGFRDFLLYSGVPISSNVLPCRNHYIFQTICNIAKTVMHLLYKDSTTYLDRKYQKYLELTQEKVAG